MSFLSFWKHVLDAGQLSGSYTKRSALGPTCDDLPGGVFLRREADFEIPRSKPLGARGYEGWVPKNVGVERGRRRRFTLEVSKVLRSQVGMASSHQEASKYSPDRAGAHGAPRHDPVFLGARRSWLQACRTIGSSGASS